MPAFSSLSILLLPLLWQLSGAATPQGACNNSPDLCSRTYDNVTHLGAHDSPFLRDSSTHFSTSGNQFYNSTVQLDSGVRLLTAQVHTIQNSATGQNESHLCHSDCSLLDAGKLSDWLAEIKSWMDANPNDVVTILLVNSDNLDANELDGEFSASGIKPYAYTPSSATAPAIGSWPTLGALIKSKTRLMTFVASLDPPVNSVAPYLMDEFTFIFENPFEVTDASNFTCVPDRPTSVKGSSQAAAQSNRMFLMNHFLDQAQLFGIETPDVDAIAKTNSPTLGTSGGLAQHMANCAGVYGKAPTFALVDFSNVGPAVQSVDRVNGIQQPVGRSALTTAVLQDQSTGNGGATGRGRVGGDKGSHFAFIVGFIVAIGLFGWS